MDPFFVPRHPPTPEPTSDPGLVHPGAHIRGWERHVMVHGDPSVGVIHLVGQKHWTHQSELYPFRRTYIAGCQARVAELLCDIGVGHVFGEGVEVDNESHRLEQCRLAFPTGMDFSSINPMQEAILFHLGGFSVYAALNPGVQLLALPTPDSHTRQKVALAGNYDKYLSKDHEREHAFGQRGADYLAAGRAPDREIAIVLGQRHTLTAENVTFTVGGESRTPLVLKYIQCEHTTSAREAVRDFIVLGVKILKDLSLFNDLCRAAVDPISAHQQARVHVGELSVFLLALSSMDWTPRKNGNATSSDRKAFIREIDKAIVRLTESSSRMPEDALGSANSAAELARVLPKIRFSPFTTTPEEAFAEIWTHVRRLTYRYSSARGQLEKQIAGFMILNTGPFEGLSAKSGAIATALPTPDGIEAGNAMKRTQDPAERRDIARRAAWLPVETVGHLIIPGALKEIIFPKLRFSTSPLPTIEAAKETLLIWAQGHPNVVDAIHRAAMYGTGAFEGLVSMDPFAAFTVDRNAISNVKETVAPSPPVPNGGPSATLNVVRIDPNE